MLQTGDQARGSFVNSGSGIRVCRWSPDGSKMATAGDDEKATLWDMTSLEELQYVPKTKKHNESKILYTLIDCLIVILITVTEDIPLEFLKGTLMPLQHWLLRLIHCTL